MKIRKLSMLAATLSVAVAASGVSAQGTGQQQGKEQPKPERDVLIERNVIITAPGHGEGHPPPSSAEVMQIRDRQDTVMFVSSEMSFDGKVVKGTPYSAESVTETVQALADGNRIVRRNTAAVYRDSEGRTRRDQTLGAVGPFAAAGDPPQTFFINDPVAGVNYILDPRSRTARKIMLPKWHLEERKDGTIRATVTTDPSKKTDPKIRVEEYVVNPDNPGTVGAVRVPRRHPGAGEFEMAPLPAPPHGEGFGVTEFYRNPSSSDLKKESLGKQTIEGVEAEGTRSTTTIPAGAIGNQQPIQIISERWYSPELQTVVMTRHSDPRSGETTFKLTNINRSEPARSLFEVPADYTVKEAGPMIRNFKMAKPNKEK
ncbi:MAG: hypothetical protein M3458_04015 [Acidobacteriota bacterium]|nr:hypothetical protein [Acidobacteriota bacterium]